MAEKNIFVYKPFLSINILDFSYFHIKTAASSGSDLRLGLAYRFLRHVIWAPRFKKGGKRKTNVLNKNKVSYVTLFSKLNIKSEHIKAVNKT